MVQNFGLARGRIDRQRPAVLVVRRAGERDGVFAVFRPLRVKKLHVAFAFLRALRLTPRFRSLLLRGLRRRLRLTLIRLRLLLPVINPVHLAGLDRNYRQSRAALFVAHLVAAWNVFGIGRFGNIVRHNGVFRACPRLDYRSQNVFAVGRERQVGDRLARGRRERFALLALFAFGLLLFAILRALADRLDQFALFLLDLLLALVAALL